MQKSLVAAAFCCVLVAGCGRHAPRSPDVSLEPGPTQPTVSGRLLIYIPCGVAGPYGAIQELFEKRYPDVDIDLEVANVYVETQKILNGKATPDVWLSLGDREIKAAAEKGLIDGKPVTYAYNSVGMIVARKNPCGISSLRDLRSPKVKTIALPSDSNSSGYYVKKALQKVGVWDDIQAKLWITDQPAKVKQQMLGGHADAGIVYYPCTKETAKVGGEQRHVGGKIQVLGKIPTDLTGRIPAQAAVVKGCKNPELGHRFLQFLLEEPCQDIWEDWAFDRAVPPKAGERVTLYIYCGAGIRPFMDPAIEAYQKRHPNTRLDVGYAGSGCLLSQLTFARRGDLYIPGEDYYLNQAKKRGLITEDKLIGYFEPVLIVQKGNPKNIHRLSDLTRPGIKVGVGEPEACAVGRAAAALLKKAGVYEKVQPNIAVRAGNVPELGNQVKLKALDVAVVWNVTAAQVADACDAIRLPRILYDPSPVPLGILKFSKHPDIARSFLNFCASAQGQELVKAAGMSPAAEGGAAP